MSVPPGSPVPPDPTGQTQPQPPHPPTNGVLLSSGGSFWDSDTNRLVAIISGILIGCLVLGSMAAIAAVGVGALGKDRDGRPGMMRNNDGRDGPQGPMGKRGRGEQDAPGGQGGQGGMRGGADAFAGVQHGDVVVTGPNGLPQTKRIARGTTTAVTPTSVTIKSTDGYDSVFAVDASTKILGNQQGGSASSLVVGQNVFAIGTVAATTATAERIMVTPS